MDRQDPQHQERALLVLGSDQQDWPDELEFSLQAGAHGYCRVDVDAMQLHTAIISLTGGGAWFDGQAFELLRERLSIHTREPDASTPLTKRETEVLELLAKGMTNAEIARQLLFSRPTVKVHVREILAKLNVRNRAQASSEAVRRGLV